MYEKKEKITASKMAKQKLEDLKEKLKILFQHVWSTAHGQIAKIIDTKCVVMMVLGKLSLFIIYWLRGFIIFNNSLNF